MFAQKIKAAEDLADGKVPSHKRHRPSNKDADGFGIDSDDDYDMICVRGGSPQNHQKDGVHVRLQQQQLHEEQQISGDSYDSASYDSYDDRRRPSGSFRNKGPPANVGTVSRNSKRSAGSRRRAAEDSEVKLIDLMGIFSFFIVFSIA